MATSVATTYSAEQVEQAKREYRAQLLEWQHASQGSYDRTVIYLSAGALGISFTFLRDFVGVEPVKSVPFMLLAWASWTGSLVAALGSFYTSACALGKAVAQLDSGSDLSRPGGRLDAWTRTLNLVSGGLLVLGIGSLGVFVYVNAGK